MPPPLKFPDLIKERRKTLGMTRVALRSRAGVGAALVGILEDQEESLKFIQSLGNPKYDRDRMPHRLASVAKICRALAIRWEDVIAEIQEHFPSGIRVNPSDIERHVLSEPGENAWWDSVKPQLAKWRNTQHANTEGIPVTAAVLLWEPFSWLDSRGELSKECFFSSITEAVLQLVDPYLRIRPIPCNRFSELHDCLKGNDSRAQLIVGMLPTRTRRELYGVEFIPLPGLRVRLGCLTLSRYASAFSWEDVLAALGYSNTAPRPCRVITTRGSVANGLRRIQREPDRRKGGTVTFVESLDAHTLASEFVEEMNSDTSDAKPIFLVGDETTCALTARILEAKLFELGYRAPGDQVCEVGADSALSFDLSFAAPTSEVKWIKHIRQALSFELYNGYAVETARTYAQIFDRAAAKNLVWKNGQKREILDYLRLRDFPNEIELGERFFNTFCSHIQRRQDSQSAVSTVDLLPYSRQRETRLWKVLEYVERERAELRTEVAELRKLSENNLP